MKKVFALTAAIMLLGLGIAAQANVFSLGGGLRNLETVSVGDAGNAADTVVMSTDHTTGYGSVGYNYNIGKYEVTAGQYTDFLNNKAKCDGDPYGLYNASMGDPSFSSRGCNIQRSGGGTVANPYVYSVASDWANRPVNFVSYWDSVRFANWLGNGQGSGSTETGAYTLTTSGIANNTITRNAGWKWAVTSEDEWYKAAYYKGGTTNAGYWPYAASSDTVPGQDMADASGNNANFYTKLHGLVIGSPYYRTEVGEFQNSDSPYGTFDQGGNVWEWNEAILYAMGDPGWRGMRGSAFSADGIDRLHSWHRNLFYATDEQSTIGFRVAQAVPEPSSLLTLGALVMPMLAFRRRKPADQ